jgi:hypothetical protein
MHTLIDRIKCMADSQELVLPAGYGDLQSGIKNEVVRGQALRSVTTQFLELRWSIGMTILDRQKIDEWGSGAVGRPNDDLFAVEVRRELAAAARHTPTFDSERP